MNNWPLAIVFWVIAVGLFGYFLWSRLRKDKQKGAERTGIRMKGGKGRFGRTRIHGQDTAVDTQNTELKMDETEID